MGCCELQFSCFLPWKKYKVKLIFRYIRLFGSSIYLVSNFPTVTNILCNARSCNNNNIAYSHTNIWIYTLTFFKYVVTNGLEHLKWAEVIPDNISFLLLCPWSERPSFGYLIPPNPSHSVQAPCFPYPSFYLPWNPRALVFYTIHTHSTHLLVFSFKVKKWEGHLGGSVG